MSHTMWRMMSQDADSVKGARLKQGLVQRVAEYAKPYRWMLVGFVVTILMSSLLGLVGPLLFKSIIDDTIPRQDTHALTVQGLLIIGSALAVGVLGLAERYWSSKIGEGLIFDLRTQLYDHVQRQPIAFFTRTQTGALVSRLNNDVIGAQRAFTGTLGTVISNVVTVVVTLIAMTQLDWRLTLLAVALLPAFVIPAKRVGRRLATITRDGMTYNAEMNSIMTERFGVAGALLVKTYGDSDRELGVFASRAAKVRDIGIRSAMLTRVFMTTMSIVGAIGTAAVYWYGGAQVINGALTVGTLTAMAALVVRIYEPLTSLTNARVDVMSAFVSFERVFEVLDTPNPIQDPTSPIDVPTVRGDLKMAEVHFAYPVTQDSVASLEGGAAPSEGISEPVLRNVSFTAQPGQQIALVGPSGSGKSTIASLLCRLYDVDTGSITLDGHDIRDMTQDQLRSHIGIVAQDPHMFHATVRENLLLAKPTATDSQLTDACRNAHILDVIQALPLGFDTIVGERGYRLSGGEKQRLAIARMLLKDPAIVILDEATSSLDTESEAAVQAALNRALDGRTSVVIAHRLSTIVHADQILVLEDGVIVQQGTHDELLARGGLYADLYEHLVSDANSGAR